MSSTIINQINNRLNTFTHQRPRAIEREISSYAPIEVKKAKK